MTLTPKKTLELCERLEKLYAGVVSDAMHDKVRDRFCPVISYTTPQINICGPAFTTWGRPVESQEDAEEIDPIRIEMLEHFPEGGIQVLDVGPEPMGVSHFGDITARTIWNAGGKGTITNGQTRDLQLIEAMEYPLVYFGKTPIDAVGRWMLSGYGDQPVNFGYRLIYPGDILFVSSDGILIIPKDELEEVCEKAEEIFAKEAAVRQELNSDSPMTVYKRHGRW
jgi:4-hydroxy-4-methyl-2-oxoglutarate aldolase